MASPSPSMRSRRWSHRLGRTGREKLRRSVPVKVPRLSQPPVELYWANSRTLAPISRDSRTNSRETYFMSGISVPITPVCTIHFTLPLSCVPEPSMVMIFRVLGSMAYSSSRQEQKQSARRSSSLCHIPLVVSYTNRCQLSLLSRMEI